MDIGTGFGQQPLGTDECQPNPPLPPQSGSRTHRPPASTRWVPHPELPFRSITLGHRRGTCEVALQKTEVQSGGDHHPAEAQGQQKSWTDLEGSGPLSHRSGRHVSVGGHWRPQALRLPWPLLTSWTGCCPRCGGGAVLCSVTPSLVATARPTHVPPYCQTSPGPGHGDKATPI